MSQYKTQKDITALHKKVKYPSINNSTDFEAAVADLKMKRFNSTAAEKRRNVTMKFTTSFYKDYGKIEKMFSELVNGYFKAISVNLTYNRALNVDYVLNNKKNLHKLMLVNNEKEGELYFACDYIINDVIYTDSFWIFKNRSGKTKLRVIRAMFLPITQDSLSQHTWTSKWLNKKQFKLYKKQIMEGVNREW